MSRATGLGLVLAAAAAWVCPAFAQGLGEAAAGAGRNDLTSMAPEPAAPATDAGDVAPPRPAPAAAPARHSGEANPLWAIPLDSLRASRERPLFSISRRAPAEPVAFVVPVVSEAPPPPAEPEKPPMTLVGVIHGEGGEIGIFLDRTGPGVIRLRIGQQDRGWVLRAADLRTATLEKDSQQVKLELPPRNAPPGSGGPEIAAASNPMAPPPPPP